MAGFFWYGGLEGSAQLQSSGGPTIIAADGTASFVFTPSAPGKSIFNASGGSCQAKFIPSATGKSIFDSAGAGGFKFEPSDAVGASIRVASAVATVIFSSLAEGLGRQTIAADGTLSFTFIASGTSPVPEAVSNDRWGGRFARTELVPLYRAKLNREARYTSRDIVRPLLRNQLITRPRKKRGP